MKYNTTSGGALWRFTQVTQKTGISRTKTTQLEKDGKFPKRIALGHRLVVWKEKEILEFCDDPVAYRAGE